MAEKHALAGFWTSWIPIFPHKPDKTPKLTDFIKNDYPKNNKNNLKETTNNILL